MLASGTHVGRYVVLDQLGEGAMGEVYRAWDDALDRVVALKLLLPLRAENEQARRRFARESRLAARINHPAVAHVYDVGEHEGVPYIAMEFVPGKQLRGWLGSPMREARVVGFVRQILEGLAEAHAQGVVHRDLKPENILISGRDQVKILDFGLAKGILDDVSEATSLSNTGITGTPRYMAPEQIQGTPVDPRTDIYALGAVMYEMITGAPCHEGRTLGEMLTAVVHKPAPEIPEALCSRPLALMVRRALQKRPEHRFQDAGAMLAEILALTQASLPADPITGPITPGPAHPRAEKFAQRAREALTGMTSSSSLALELLEQALRLDPDYALAHALYAEACAAVFNTGHVDASWLDRAQGALDRAEALDPTLPDVRVARARLLWTKTFNFPAETALRELRAALKVDPDHLGALRLWATIAAHVGLFEQAEAAITRRLAQDPQDEVTLLLSAGLYIAEGRPERAVELLTRPTQLDPNHEDHLFWWNLAHALVVEGRLEEAEAALQGNLRRRPDEPLSLALLGVLCAARGDAVGARRATEAAEAHLQAELHPHHCYHLMACAESLLGEPQASLHWLRRTADEGMPCYPWFAQDPLLANLRADPGGRAFLAELERRHAFFRAEFPVNDPATLGLTATLT
jgi:serine/threonine protein kinase/cytochrome c-type biogenesis protein CcmH/NrfG